MYHVPAFYSAPEDVRQKKEQSTAAEKDVTKEKKETATAYEREVTWDLVEYGEEYSTAAGGEREMERVTVAEMSTVRGPNEAPDAEKSPA